MTRSTILRAAVALTAVLMLAGCVPGPPGGPSDAGAVGFDGVQSATIQLEARGTFVDPQYGGYEAAGRGSGFLISPEGLAITNNHVVTGAGTLDVWRGGDTTRALNARVLGASECLDLAVVRLETGTYPYLAWHRGDITTAMDVYAAGFPLGDPTFTMTRGIVSKAQTAMATSWAAVDTVIEHDARIRPGNSGGPLVTPEGRLVGVNYAGNNVNDTNFAVHRDEVLEVVEALIAGENVLSLGINGQGIVGDDGSGLGIWVSSVAAGSPADVAGVVPGDVVTRLQGVSVATDGTLAEYCDVLRTHGVEAVLDLEIFRPSDGLYHRGQINGRALQAVQVAPGGGSASGEFVDVVDDTASLFVQIPASWTQVDTAPFTDARGTPWAQITASPSIPAFQGSWAAPGVTVMASPAALGTTSVDALLAAEAAWLPGVGCRSGGVEPFTDGYHTGGFEYWTGCGPERASYLVLAAVADSGNYLVSLVVQAASDSDLAAVDRILGSFIADF